nr:hypothetical protein [Tanacetum cinerariifolium]
QELEAHYSYMAKIHEVPTADSGTDSDPMEHVQNEAGYNVFANHLQHSEQSEYVSNTCLVETDDSNVTYDSPDMCEDDIQNEQNGVESDDERVALANLIVNLKLDVDENKKIQKQLKKANTTLAQELKECKAIIAETSKFLGESISVRDSCLIYKPTNNNLRTSSNSKNKNVDTAPQFKNDIETPTNMSPENKAHFLAEKEAIHLILTGIGDDIYSTVDAFQTTQEMWEAIERLQQGQRSISSTTLAGMVKQYQNEVNELRAEKLARNPNPLALVATAQASQGLFYQSPRSHRSSAPSPKPSIPARSHTSTRHKGKEIAKPITPPSEIAFEEDNDPE